MEQQDRHSPDTHAEGVPDEEEKKKKKPHKRGGGQAFARKKKAEEQRSANQAGAAAAAAAGGSEPGPSAARSRLHSPAGSTTLAGGANPYAADGVGAGSAAGSVGAAGSTWTAGSGHAALEVITSTQADATFGDDVQGTSAAAATAFAAAATPNAESSRGPTAGHADVLAATTTNTARQAVEQQLGAGGSSTTSASAGSFLDAAAPAGTSFPDYNLDMTEGARSPAYDVGAAGAGPVVPYHARLPKLALASAGPSSRQPASSETDKETRIEAAVTNVAQFREMSKLRKPTESDSRRADEQQKARAEIAALLERMSQVGEYPARLPNLASPLLSLTFASATPEEEIGRRNWWALRSSHGQ